MENMKKAILIAAAGAMTLASCNNFIDLDPISQQNANAFYKDSLEMDQALTAAYNALQSINQYGGNGYAHFMEVPADNTWDENTTMDGGAYAAFDNFMVDPTNAQLERTWIACYDGIQRCNIVVSRLLSSDSEAITEDFKNRKLGEAYFLRALTYFNMVRMWGDIPLITAEVTDVNEAFNHTRAAAEEVYQQIIADLEFAVNNLPASYNAANVGRATRGAAQTLLTKVYLTRHDYPSAQTLLNNVIASGQYRLLDNFADVFAVNNKNNAESIFEVQYDGTIEGQGYPGQDPLITGSDINNLPSDNLLRLFEENPDDRAAASVIDMGVQGWRLYKWHGTKGSNNGMDFNIIVLRYADVLLMASEVMNEIGYGDPAALEYLNQVRRRSHATEYTYADLPNQQAFRDAIEKERRLELAFENHRWFDLVRTGRALEVMNSCEDGAIFDLNVESYRLVFPIPQNQIDASGGSLTQNEGY